MADKRVIAVLGSTGWQGGGLAKAILDDATGGFACRAITRDTTKDKARALAAKGAEVANADLDDVGSLEKAFACAYGAFCLTNFWEHLSAEKEKLQAKNLANAARAAGVKHVILVDAGGHAQADGSGRYADAVFPGEVSGAAL
jgi:uncharacterized protein YbjT (DUF2867 family)